MCMYKLPIVDPSLTENIEHKNILNQIHQTNGMFETNSMNQWQHFPLLTSVGICIVIIRDGLRSLTDCCGFGE